MKISELQKYLEAKLQAEGDLRVVCNDGETCFDIDDCLESENELIIYLVPYKF